MQQILYKCDTGCGCGFSGVFNVTFSCRCVSFPLRSPSLTQRWHWKSKFMLLFSFNERIITSKRWKVWEAWSILCNTTALIHITIHDGERVVYIQLFPWILLLFGVLQCGMKPWSHALWCMMCVLLCGRTNWAWCESGKFQVGGRCLPPQIFLPLFASRYFEPTRRNNCGEMMKMTQFDFSLKTKKRTVTSNHSVTWKAKALCNNMVI